MTKFQIFTGSERCHKNFPVKISCHFIPQHQTPAALLSILVTYCCMRKTTFKKKNPTADLSYNFSVHQFLLVHCTCHRQLWWSFFPSIQSSPVYPRGSFSLYCNLHIAREYITVAKMFWMHRLVPCVALAPSHPCWHSFNILCSLNCNDHFFASSSLIFYHMIIISVRQWCWSYL